MAQSERSRLRRNNWRDVRLFESSRGPTNRGIVCCILDGRLLESFRPYPLRSAGAGHDDLIRRNTVGRRCSVHLSRDRMSGRCAEGHKR
jgi:hypothetical protein